MMSSATHKRVQVCIRVRPPVTKSEALALSGGSVVVNEKEKTVSVVTNAAAGSGTCFHFDQVLDSKTDQAGVYQVAASQIVDSVLSGYNGTIMAYGQTGAGKTFTMSGGRRNFDDRGICARAISSIFQQINRDADHTFVVRVSYVEVYNENLYDLLNFNESHHGQGSNNNSNAREDLVIQENDKGQTFVRGLLRPIVKTEEHAFDLLFQGETNRTIAEHCLNASSTRSHCIFTVYVERHANADAAVDTEGDVDLSSSVAVFSKLHLVDLAGSERMKKTHVSGVMLKEASHINKSLTFLEQVVIALGDKKRQHIPYRQTPLTNLLKDSLGGNCRTMLVACVWPEDSHNDQTLATLKFATRMMRVKTSAIVNVAGGARGGANGSATSAETQALLQKYVAEIKRLKDELAMHDTLSGRSCVDYDLKTIKSTSARKTYRGQVQEFIREESKRLPVENLAQVDQLFTTFRDLYLEGNQASQTNVQALSTLSNQAPASVSTTTATSESRMVKQFRALRGGSPLPPPAPQQPDAERVQLPLLARSSTFSVSKSEPSNPADDDDGDPRTKLPLLRPNSACPQSQVLPPATQHSEKELFDLFKQLTDPKPESLLDLEVAKQNLRQAKTQMSSLGLEVNKIKLSIDSFTMKLHDAKGSASNGDRGEGDEAVGLAVEFLVLQLKDAKKQYREAFERFQEKKAEVNYLLKIKDQMLHKVTREFELWRTSAAVTSGSLSLRPTQSQVQYR